MKYSRIAVRILKNEEEIFYDPVYHGRTLKVFGMDEWPVKFMEYIAGKYGEIGYERVIFDTTGKLKVGGVITIEDGKEAGLDPIRMALKGYFDSYTAATAIETIYGLDRFLTEKLYADILKGRVKSVEDALGRKEKYSEVIAETYTGLDEALYSGDPPELGGSFTLNLGKVYSITTASNAFLIVAAAVEKRRETMVGVNDAGVLSYTDTAAAALPLLTKPMMKRVTVLTTQYALDSVMKLGGPSLILYHDPDVQGVIYEANGVPPGPMRKHVHKGEGAFVYRTPETVDVRAGLLEF